MVNLIKKELDSQDTHWTLSSEQYTGDDSVSFKIRDLKQLIS
jgi:hypothetical protein